MNRSIAAALLFVPALIAGCAGPAPQGVADGLGGTSWRLVKFQGGDGTVLRPDDKSKYTLAFGADGNVSARIDCNRGRGAWKSARKGAARIRADGAHARDVPAGLAA